ncbi:hypothetical protein [Streptomyces sp. DH24]|uniref:hypothetical protein n=1 Tax=Streptomyces sp. DH24 TaxID=3040123 RepID=UPI00244162F8|nr:hypothetical protein [Streptomyces sp. DH24]MDG9721111.1 hypothetical protein [Streptomyces sp. DH24]
MSRFDTLLGTDFDGRPAGDVEDVIYDGLDDPRHRDWVPGRPVDYPKSRAVEWGINRIKPTPP